MSDIFISHAPEDRAACQRLTKALEQLGLVVESTESPKTLPPGAGPADHPIDNARGTIVIWSRSAIGSELVIAEAQRAHALSPQDGAASPTRYLGLILDTTEPDDLPEPFDDARTAQWPAWFGSDDIDFDSSAFHGLLARLEDLTGRKRLASMARAFADHAQEIARLHAQVRVKDEALAQSQAMMASVDATLSARVEELAQQSKALDERSARISELERLCDALESERTMLAASVEARAAELAIARRATTDSSDALAAAQQALRDAQSAKASLEMELEDARNGLAAGLRQQGHLNVLLKASDDNLAETILQREDLRGALQSSEQKAAKLAAHLNDLTRRLGETDLLRQTYETALIERKKEFDQVTEVAQKSASEAGQLAPQVQNLKQTIADWANVPWRSIAAGSMAAGAVLTYGVISGERLLRDWIEPSKVTAAAPASAPPTALKPTEPAPPKSAAKLEPDTFQIEDRPDPGDVAGEEPVPATPASGEIAIPDETVGPPDNDKVVFNPDGLPPVDPESRPPPQDLPPMQQKPKLLLKPPAPPDPPQ